MSAEGEAEFFQCIALSFLNLFTKMYYFTINVLIDRLVYAMMCFGGSLDDNDLSEFCKIRR